MKINVSPKKEATLSEGLIELIKKKLKTMRTPEIYWDYRDQLSDEQIGKIISTPEGLNNVENEIFENNLDHTYDLEMEHLVDALGYFKAELAKELNEEDVDLKEVAQELRDEFLDYLSVDTNIRGLISNSRSANCRIMMYSNYDCINSNWFVTSGGGYRYIQTYFGAIVDLLNLNPAKIKAAFMEAGIPIAGSFPNKKNRDGKEYVKYDQFAREMENNSCTGLFTIVCQVDLSDVLKHGGMPKKFIIPKGNTCGIFSSWEGGGSMIDCELIRDMEIDLSKRHGSTEHDTLALIPDTKEHGYTMKNDVYGVTDDFFGNEITFVTK